MIEECEFLGIAKTNNNYTMVCGPNFPFLLEREGEGAVGEVYSGVTEYLLAHLDMIEGHPSFYQRKGIVVSLEGEDIPVWAYIHPDDYRMSRYPIINDFTKEFYR